MQPPIDEGDAGTCDEVLHGARYEQRARCRRCADPSRDVDGDPANAVLAYPSDDRCWSPTAVRVRRTQNHQTDLTAPLTKS
jgi:hypothetical protein